MAKEGTKTNSWKLKNLTFSSDYEIYKEVKDGKELHVYVVGKTTLRYGCLKDLPTMLKRNRDWIKLMSVDEQKPIKENTVGAWGRSKKKLVAGWYELKKELRGSFGIYIPYLMENLWLAELTHQAKVNKMKSDILSSFK
jgi:hypothetical protein